MIGLIALYFSAVGIYYFEQQAQPEVFSSVIHSLWWAVVTLTTVGYGDVYPITLGGRIFSFFVIMVGVGFVSVPSGIMASALSEARKAEKDTETSQEGKVKQYSPLTPNVAIEPVRITLGKSQSVESPAQPPVQTPLEPKSTRDRDFPGPN